MENNLIWQDIEEIEDDVFARIWDKIMSDYAYDEWLDGMDYYDAESPKEFVIEYGLADERERYIELKSKLQHKGKIWDIVKQQRN